MTTRPVIAFSRRLPAPVFERFASLGEVRVPSGDGPPNPGELAALLAPADAALITAIERIDVPLLDACPRLKLIANIGAGYDNIDVAACTARGITVTNTPGGGNDAVADLVFGLMLGIARRVAPNDAFVRSGRWAETGYGSIPPGLDVAGRTLGIVGFGQIGRTVAKRALGFDMPVLYFSRRRADEAVERELRATAVGLDDLLERSDFVVVQVPYAPETHHLIGAAQLARMKPTAVLVNAARGGVIDDAALADALQAGRLAGAALDCFEGEPSVHPSLLKAPNVLLSPHVGSATTATRQRLVQQALANLVAGLSGQRPPDTVNSVQR